MRTFYVLFLLGVIPSLIGAVSMIVIGITDFTVLMLEIGAVGFVMFGIYLLGTMIHSGMRA